MTRLIDGLKPCGPVADPKAAERALTVVRAAAEEGGWTDLLETAWPALAPVFGASPYLTSLARRDLPRLRDLLLADPDARFADLLARTAALSDLSYEAAKVGLRKLKAEAHLLIALADLGGVWDLDAVTGALARFADAALITALTVAARSEVEAGRQTAVGEGAAGPVPGYFAIAMGKHGAYELNYS
ncbi:MAG: glutamine-synthetase adenylyltransferase, partial [Phenylobacterium sp.]|nr:glutamine-synthetase adenylyltransferase [Phenylobacterium sp.]